MLAIGFSLPTFSAQSNDLHFSYQTTASSPLEYRVSYQWRELHRAKLSKMEKASEAIEESAKTSEKFRALQLTKKINRIFDENYPGKQLVQISSMVQKEEASAGMDELKPQLIARFTQMPNGLPDEPFAVEAIDYFSVPIILPMGLKQGETRWRGRWYIRTEQQKDVPIEVSYFFQKNDVLAGRRCAFVQYTLHSSLESNGDMLAHDQWRGHGRFVFDVSEGAVVLHEVEITRRRQEQVFHGASRLSKTRETLYEIAEVLVP